MKVYKDELIQVWRRTTYEVDNENNDEVIDMVLDDLLEIIDSEILFETEEVIKTEILDVNLELMFQLR